MDLGITTEMIWQSFFSGIWAVLVAALPMLVPVLAGIIVVSLIKRIACAGYDFIYFSSSKRETKRAHSKINNAIDTISALNDLKDTMKK